MRKRIGMLWGLLFTLVLCITMTGCAPLQSKIEKYSSNKKKCSLNTENVTQFNYKSEQYTILEDTVSNENLGDWIGYIRQFAAVDESGKVLVQENIETATFHTLADLDHRAPDAAYIIPFLNVYAAPNETSDLIVDVNGGYHRAVLSSKITDADRVFDFKAVSQIVSSRFAINPDNSAQLIYNGTVYQVTLETVSDDKLGKYLDILAESVTFDTATGKGLTKEERNKIDWSGTGQNQQRENWIYMDIHEISGMDKSEAVAVRVNNQYYIARKQ